MGRRERLLNRLEKRQEWSALAARRSSAALSQARDMASVIPFGQPILVGHHSEKSDRAYRGRIENKFRKGFELGKLAEHHEAKAAGIEPQLERSIFSDDDNAIEAIEARIEEHEAQRERMKKVNALYRKGDVEGLKLLGIDYEDLKAKLAAAGGYWGSAPHLAYELSNLGARIQADKKRIAVIKYRRSQAEKAETAGGMLITRHQSGYATVTFAEKPDRNIINDLKAAGFYWSGGSWGGQTEKMPASVIALESPAEQPNEAA